MKKSKWLAYLASAIIVSSIAYSCGLLEDSGDQGTTVGTVLPVSGDLSTLGPGMQKSIDLAFELVNEAGGVNGGEITALHRDSGTSEQGGTDAASGLVNVDGVNVLLGAVSSGVTIAMAESVTIPAGVLHMSPASSSNAITALADDDMVFRTRVNDAVKSQVLAELAAAAGYSRVSTTYVNNAYGSSLNDSFIEAFEAMGGIVTNDVSHELGQASYLSEIRDAAEGNPEVLLTIAYPDSGQILLREAAEGEYYDEFMFVDVTRSQTMFDAIGGNYFEGDFGVSPGAPASPAVDAFRRLYAERTHGDPSASLITEAFDAAVILALAIEKAGSDDPVAVRDALRPIANPPGEVVGPGDVAKALELVRDGKDINYVGASGDVDFDQAGNVVSSMRVWYVEDNTIIDSDIYALPGDDIDLSLISAIDPSSSISDDPTPSDGEASVKIGTVLPRTGDLSFVGKERELAVSFAFELVNEVGGVNGKRIEALHRDSGTDPEVGKLAASALISEHGVPAIIGAASSGVTKAIAEAVTIPNGVLQVSPSSSSSLITTLDDDDLVFRTTFSDVITGEVAAELAREIGWESVATTHVSNAYGTSMSSSFSDHFRALGGNVTAQVSHDKEQSTYAPQLKEATAGDSEALIAIAYTDTSRTLLREAVDDGYFKEFLFFTPAYNQELFDALGAGKFEGSYGTKAGTQLTPAREWFFENFEARKNGNIEITHVSEAFDAGLMIALAIEKADSEEPFAIRDALREIANPPGVVVGPQDVAKAFNLVRAGEDVNYVGASGQLDFDINGDVIGTVEIWRIKDGEIGSTGIFVSPGDPIDLPDVSSTESVPTEFEGVVKIGTLLPSTGDLAFAGPHGELAMSLAFDLVNESGGVNGKRLEGVHRDTGTSVQLGTDAANALVNIDGVPVIIGAVASGVTLAVAESVTIPNGVLLISPASSSNAFTTLDDDDLVFRTSVSDAVKGVVAARLARELGFDHVATTYVNNAFGVSVSGVFSDHFKELGGEVLDEISHELGQPTYTSELRKAAKSNPDALIPIGYTETLHILLREAVEGQYFDDFLFFSPAYYQDLFDNVGADYFEGDYGIAPGAPLSPARRWFFDTYEQRKDGNINIPLMSEVFDATILAALAIEKADSEDPAEIRDALRMVSRPPGEQVGPQDIAQALELIRNGQEIDYVGAAGDLNFDENGDVQGTIEIWNITDGVVGSTGIFALPGEPINLRAVE
ncbi:MAG: ABC transporter substrate-binding protein [Chloroflexi bacterium]|nr:ABC transporter substrate-binding protein [Chloroflexota bacterium]